MVWGTQVYLNISTMCDISGLFTDTRDYAVEMQVNLVKNSLIEIKLLFMIIKISSSNNSNG